MIVTFVKKIKESPNVISYLFNPVTKLDYQAGQFIEMTLPHDSPDDRGIKHWFTLSSSPSERYISVTTRHSIPSSTFKQSLSELVGGQEVTISEAMGDFVLPKDKSISLLFVAGGIGITPMRSMVKFLIDNDETRPIKLIYGAKNDSDLAFIDLFKSNGIVPEIVVSSSELIDNDDSRHITPEMIIANSTDNGLIYISGPEPMVESLEEELLKSGINSRQLVLDFFPNYKDY